MKIDLQGRKALVTGGSRGIGRAIARALAGCGADVAIIYRRDEAAAQAVVEELRSMGRQSFAYRTDMTDWETCRSAIEAITAEMGTLDLLVNNAGLASRGQSVFDSDPTEPERLMRTNAFAPYWMSKAALPQLRQRGRADIVMVSSVIAYQLSPNAAPYAMSKTALNALAVAMAREERQYGVRTHIISPTLTATDMGQRVARARGKADIHELNDRYPFGRVAEPEDVASMVAFMVSDLNAYANGQNIYVDGGGT